MRHTTIITALLVFFGCDNSKTTPEGGDPDTSTDTSVVGDTTEMEPSYGECVTDEDCTAGDDPCGVPYCDLHSLLCMVRPPDEDGDGYLAMEVDGESCASGTDCDDTNPSVHPGAPDEGCDWVDNDCDGIVGRMDDDGDGFGDLECYEDDCDDDDPAINPEAADLCDTVDQDCDGSLLDADGADDDGDGFLDEDCGGDDCDDDDPTLNPAAIELCDDIDNNCDGITDNPTGLTDGIQVSSTDTWGLERPRLAWSGSEYAVAWIDQRLGPRDLFMRRVTGTGTMASSEILITEGGAQAQWPTMAWTGSEYGLVWEDTRLGPGDVYFARVDADGTVLLAQERITIDLGETRGPDIEWTGSEFGVAFADDRDAILEDEIWFVRLEADGTKIGSDVMVTTGTTGTWSMRPSLEWTGSTWGVGWTDDFMDFQFALFTPDGTMIHQETVSTESEMMDARPDIEWTGSEFATAWFNVGTGDNYMFARIGADGSKVGSDVVLATGMMGGPGLTVNLDWTGSEYGVFWTGFDEMTGTEHLVMTRVAGDGTILMAPTPLLVPDTDIILGMGFDLAFNGANFGFVSQQYVSTPTDGFDQVMLHMLVECD